MSAPDHPVPRHCFCAQLWLAFFGNIWYECWNYFWKISLALLIYFFCLDHNQINPSEVLLLNEEAWFRERFLLFPPLLFGVVCLFVGDNISQCSPGCPINSIYKPGCPHTHRDPRASASKLLGSKACATELSFQWENKYEKKKKKARISSLLFLSLWHLKHNVRLFLRRIKEIDTSDSTAVNLSFIP